MLKTVGVGNTIYNFNERYDNFKYQEEQMKRKFDFISTVRLLIFLVGTLISIIYFIKKQNITGGLIIVFFLILFICTVLYHSIIYNKLNSASCKVKVNKEYVDRINGEWINFQNSGIEYVDVNHDYSVDLDIFGAKSLYQWICTAKTYYGKNKFYQLLTYPDKDISNIKKRQKAVIELYERIDFCQNLQCEGIDNKNIDIDPQKLLDFAEDKSKLFVKSCIPYLIFILPASLLITFVLLFKFNFSFYVPLFILLVQLIFVAIGYFKIVTIFRRVNEFKSGIMVFGKMIKLIEKEQIADEYLNGLKKNFIYNGKMASHQMKALEKITDAIEFSNNPIMYFILNITLLWDYHCLYALIEWKEKNGKLLRKWLETLGDFEAIISLSNIFQMNPNYNFPDFSDKAIKICAKDLGHPLIPGDKRVCNDININGNICIVTGSNMSGKTTFLRTIGINLVLAYAGAPVCAKSMECSVLNILSSMRINDDLNGGISTFYAELIRIKKIIEFCKSKIPMIFLIDEIFRGTNSKDRILGAQSVLISLNRTWIIGLISTHDFELCDLENEANGRIKNYHFTESYSNNQIHFDYKLRFGKCLTTNAKYLMKIVGIDILE